MGRLLEQWDMQATAIGSSGKSDVQAGKRTRPRPDNTQGKKELSNSELQSGSESEYSCNSRITVNRIKNSKSPKSVVRIKNKSVNATIDTGWSVNIID